ncbi:MAG: class I SAM-dependent methyltransferase [Methylococcus sp.]
MSIGNSFRVRGLGGTIQLALLHLFNFKRTPGHILSRMLDLKRYDREHNIETAGLIETDQLNVDSDSKQHGIRYRGATPWLMRDTLDRLPIDHRRYTFIDIGSGKGAALFQASDYPFRRIIGVEYAPELHEAALRNIASFRSKTRRCHDISGVCGDGGDYSFPEGPWVLFFNSPFGVPIWERVVANIQQSPKVAGLNYLIFMNYGWVPEAADYVQRLEFLHLIHRGDTVLIFEFAS